MRWTLVLVMGVMATAAGAAQAAPGADLWRAICRVESSGDARAYNRQEGAAGIVQIRPVCLRDVNRIARLRGLGHRFRHADRFNTDAARRMWRLYLDHYGQSYKAQTGRVPTAEVYARIWNGGPRGWRKATTRPYWQRVREAMEPLDDDGEVS